MALREIVKYPEPCLTEVCAPVGDDVTSMAGLAEEMAQAMFAADGAGLAAPQVGVTRRMFIIDPQVAGLPENAPPMVFIDPEILETSKDSQTGDEGCLSFPGIYVTVTRPMRVKTRARNLKGETFEVEGQGLFARAMLHENDHLNGVLLIDHVGRLKRQMIKRRMAREAAATAE